MLLHVILFSTNAQTCGLELLNPQTCEKYFTTCLSGLECFSITFAKFWNFVLNSQVCLSSPKCLCLLYISRVPIVHAFFVLDVKIIFLNNQSLFC
jgi:hypothetical protein